MPHTRLCSTTLIHILTTSAILIEMIASSTSDCVLATGIGAHCVDTSLGWKTRACFGHTLVDINAAADSILYVTVSAGIFWITAEGAGRVGTNKTLHTVMGSKSTLINVLAAVVVSKFVSSATADVTLAAK